MSLKIYNVLTRKKEDFKPLKSGKVKMYVCGITPYDECHLGHARAAVVFDVVYRHLRHSGYDVTYVRNYTDVDDKIIKRANDTNTPWSDISQKYIASYREQMQKLGVETPTHEPLCTDNIPEMVALIQKLIKNGYAYVSGSDVLYRVRKFSKYGKLSHKKIDELESGARIEIDEKKEDPLDFALWKGSKPGEPAWDSPWGQGRPGWHIECSAMSIKFLGEQFDIHGGGRDLIFPHHENEIAQSEGATGKSPFAKYWMHNGFVNINSEKMSKSLGNFRSIPVILQHWDAEVVRYFLLSAHYASPLDFNDEAIRNAQEALTRIYEALQRLEAAPPSRSVKHPIDFEKLLRDSLDDDFNTSRILGEIFQHIRVINTLLDENKAWDPEDRDRILHGFKDVLGKTLGIFVSKPSTFMDRLKKMGLKSSTLSEDEIKKLLEDRKTARQSKDFKRSDAIRDELAAKGVQIKDNPDGSTGWEIKS